MRTPRFRTIIGLLSAPAIIAGGLAAFTLASAAPAAAGQPVTQPLTPPPPSFETCKTVGNGFICEGARTMTYGPDDTGITCGTGAGAFTEGAGQLHSPAPSPPQPWASPCTASGAHAAFLPQDN